jgi:phage terminase Nu1 subunit (DNA packaging protein)
MAEVAEITGFSTRTVQRWANSGEFGELWQKGERCRRITRQGLIGFLKRHLEDWNAGREENRGLCPHPGANLRDSKRQQRTTPQGRRH